MNGSAGPSWPEPVVPHHVPGMFANESCSHRLEYSYVVIGCDVLTESGVLIDMNLAT